MSGANTVMPYVFGGLGLGHLTQQLRQNEEDRKNEQAPAVPTATPAAAVNTTSTTEDVNTRYRMARMRAYYLNQMDEGKLEKKSLLGG